MNCDFAHIIILLTFLTTTLNQQIMKNVEGGDFPEIDIFASDSEDEL